MNQPVAECKNYRKRALTLISAGLAAALLLSAAGCGGGGGYGGGGDDGDDVSDDAVDGIYADTRTTAFASSSAKAAFSSVKEAVRGGDALARQSTVTCSEQGQVSVITDAQVDLTVTPRTFSYTATASLENCDGISGSLLLNGAGTATRDLVTTTSSVQGAVSGECNADVQGLEVEATIVPATRAVSGTITGTVIVKCGAYPYTCIFDHDSIESLDGLVANCAYTP